MKQTPPCKGCSIRNNCKCTPDNNECPCIECLVKVVCEIGCDKFYCFEFKSRKKREKEYEIHLNHQGKVMAK